MSGYVAHNKCSIRFVPDKEPQREQNYSNRSTVELRQLDFADYALQGIDVDNNKRNIFNIHLRTKHQYRLGKSDKDPDEIEDDLGTYHLTLDSSTRANFHKELQKCFREIAMRNQSADSSAENDSSDEPTGQFDGDFEASGSSPEIYVPHSPVKKESMPRPTTEPPKVTTAAAAPKLNEAIVPPKDLLLDTHRLGKCMENGNEKEATQIITSLCNHGVQLQTKSLKSKQNDKKFTIQVQIDGNDYGVDQHGPRIALDVYQSTTVRELRATFELAYQQFPPNQYFFVNGALVHDNSTMKDLNVGPESVFVLFLLSHPKK